MALVLVLGVTPASADTISDKKAQAAAVQQQVEALNNKVEIAVEKYNTAADKYAKITRQVRRTEQKVAKLRKDTKYLQSHLYTRAANMYRTGPLAFLTVLLNAKTFDDFNTTWDVLTDMNNQDAQTVHSLKDARTEYEKLWRAYKVGQAAAAVQKQRMAANKKAVYAQLAERKQALNSINADIRSLIAQQQAADAAAARLRYASNTGGSSWVDPGGNPPSNLSQGQKVVYWAKTRLGCPYVWAASGPSEFDCSGLAMWCWGQVGVSLPHSSREQINCGARVSQANLEPGDLVFFGSPIHHVGIYVGGGEMIEAPYTGASVRYANAFRGDYAGACRP